MFGGFAGFGSKPAVTSPTTTTESKEYQDSCTPASTTNSVAIFGNKPFAGFGSQAGSTSVSHTQPERTSVLDDDFNEPVSVRKRTNEPSTGSFFHDTSTHREADRDETDEPRRKRGFTVHSDEDVSRLSLFNKMKSSTRSRDGPPSETSRYLPPDRRKLRESRIRIPWPSEPVDVKPLENLQKNFYCTTEQTSIRDPADVQGYLTNYSITLHGDYTPTLFLDFSELDPHFSNAMYNSQFTQKAGDCCISSILKEKYKFPSPTYIQAASWPIAIQGRDCIGIAETGSGKTFAFSIPALLHAAAQPPTSEIVPSPIVVVLAPARELVLQIYTEIEGLLSYFDSMLYKCYGDSIAYDGTKVTPLRPLYAAVSYGGKGLNEHYKKLIAEPLDILITTPGIFADFYNRNRINLSRVTYVVLDECDTMLSSGFKNEIDILLKNSSPNRQTLLWSATWPSEIEDVANSYLSENTVFLGIGNYRASVNKHIIQHIVVANSPRQKDIYLLDLLKCIMDGTFDESMEQLQGSGVFTSVAVSVKDEYHAWCSSLKKESKNQSSEMDKECSSVRVIIFTNRKASASEIHDELSRLYAGRSYVIHGDIQQSDREKALERFKSTRDSILVATDAVARGVHIEGVTHVINYDVPRDHVVYVHRCGRTGRAGKFGHAVSIFVPSSDWQTVDALAGYFKENNESAVLPPEFLNRTADTNRGAGRPSQHGPRNTTRNSQSYSKQSFAKDNDDPFDG